MLPTRVRTPAAGGGWELLPDAYAPRVDFNQSSLTLHQIMEADEEQRGATSAGGSQPCGSQGAHAPAAVEATNAVDIKYEDIRCINRGACINSCAISACCWILMLATLRVVLQIRLAL